MKNLINKGVVKPFPQLSNNKSNQSQKEILRKNNPINNLSKRNCNSNNIFKIKLFYE